MSPRVLWHLKCPIFMLIFRKRRILLFVCLFLRPFPLLWESQRACAGMRGTLQSKTRRILLNTSECMHGNWQEKDFFPLKQVTYVSDNSRHLTATQKPAGNKDNMIQFLFVTPHQSLKSWHKSSISRFFSVADSFCGHLLWFWGDIILLESREDRRSLKDEATTCCVSVKAELTPHFTPKKDYFQRALCITNEMQIFLRCGCRHVSWEVKLEMVYVMQLGERSGHVEAAVWPDTERH